MARIVFEGLEPRLLPSADLVPIVPAPLIDQALTRADSAVVSVNVQNLGDSIISTPVRVSFFASADATYSGATDFLVGSGVLAAGSLGPGGSAAIQVTLAPAQLPASGPYTLFTFVDSDQALAESNENNNVAAVGTLRVLGSLGSVALTNDTGASATDGITSDPRVTGSSSGAVSLRAGLDGTQVNAYTDVSARLQTGGNFTLDSATMNQLAGGTLSQGAHLLNLIATNGSGTATPLKLWFTLDSGTPATPTLNLSPASDTGTIGDFQTNTPIVTLTGTTEASASVTLVGLNLTTTADAQGAFQFANVTLALGVNAITVQATDLAGNSSQASRNVTLVEALHATSLTAVDALRSQIITYLWGTSSLPSRTVDKVDSNVASPLSGGIPSNLLQVDKLTINMQYGFQSIAYFFQPKGTATKLVVAQQGHWNDLESGGLGDTIRELVQQGVAVVALQMPGMGPNTGPVLFPHENLAAYDSATFSALRLFVEPVHVALNYLLARSYEKVAMIGCSGGGWTTTLCAAIDTRITLSYQIAGSYPLSIPSSRDWEQLTGHGPLYGSIGYLDLYVMGSVGAGRLQVQALNRIDPVCFSGTDWQVYQPRITGLVGTMGGTFQVHQYESPVHGIDSTCRQRLLGDLGFSLTGLSVTSAAAGTPVTLSGTDFGATQGASVVRFGTSVASVSAWSNTQITALVPTGLATTPVSVTVATANGTSNGFTFTPARIVDDGDAGFSTTGVWTQWTGQGYLNDKQQTNPTDPSSVATWQFSGLASGQYQVAATWSVNTNRATNAPYSINGGGLIRVNQQQSPGSFNADGGNWFILGVVDVTSGGLSVALSNAGVDGKVIADAIRIVRVGEISAPVLTPTLTNLSTTSAAAGTPVILSGTNFGATQGTGVVRFGTSVASVSAWGDTQITALVPAGLATTPVSVTVATINGTSNGMTFTPVVPAAAPTLTGLSVTSAAAGTPVTLSGTDFGATQGASVVRFGTSVASVSAWSNTQITALVPTGLATTPVSVTVATANGTSNGFTFTPARIVDDGDAGFSTTGVWTQWTGQGYLNDKQQTNPTDPSSVATWQFSGLASGQYQVAATWSVNTNRATNAPYSINGGGLIRVNQQQSPGSFNADGGNWFILGVVDVTSGGLSVALSNAGVDGKVIADAIRIVRVGEISAPVLTPTLTNLSTTSAAAGTPVILSGTNFGATQGTGVVRFGTSVASVSAWGDTQITALVPAGLATTPVSVTVATINGTSNGMTFTPVVPAAAPTLTGLSVTSAAAGTPVTLSGTDFGATQGASVVRFGTSVASVSAWSNTQITALVPTGLATTPVSVTVATANGTSNGFTFTPARIVDDGDAGFSTTGVWTQWTGQGYLNDKQQTNPTDPSSVATWQFSGLASGQYQVAATWSVNTNRATNAPYSINGGGLIRVNQQQSPGSFNADGGNWFILGVVDVTSGGLSVALSNAGVDGKVIADAIRIVRVGEISAPVLTPTLTNLSTTSAAAGTPVILSGTNFGATQGTGVVRFGTSVASVSAWGDTQITALVPAGLATTPVSVTVATINGTSNGMTFTPVVPAAAPTLTGLSVTSAAAGTPVTLSGTDFGATQGASVVRFGTSVASVSAWSNTQITALVPTGLATTPVSVTVATANGTSNGFTFTPARIVDDGDAGFSTTGVWTQWTGQGYLNDKQQTNPTDPSSVATWQFSGLASGQYQVAATWSVNTNRATNAPYSINGGGLIRVNQQQSPGSFNADGGNWFILGVVDVTSGGLSVALSNAGVDGKVIADAIRIVRVGEISAPVLTPTLTNLSTTSAAAGTPVILSGTNFGATQGTGVVRFGTSVASVSAWGDTQITALVPAGLATTPVSVTVATINGTSNGMTFTPVVPAAAPTLTGLSVTSAAAGTPVTLSGTDFGATQGASVVRFGTSVASVSAWSNTQITALVPTGLATTPVSVTVATANGTSNGFTFTPARIVDDGDAGFSTTGVWTQWTGQGYLNDKQQTNPTDPSSVATWQFSGLASGQYQVAATWSVNTNRATNAPYSINGGGLIRVNQQQSPGSFNADGGNWFILGVVDVTSGGLSVALSNAGVDGKVIADAIRIVRVG